MLQYLNVVALCAAAGCGLGYLSFCRLPADFQSTARIVIVSPGEPPASADRGRQDPSAAGAGESPVAQAVRELMDASTLQRALDNSLLLALRWPPAGAVSLEHIQHSLSFDEADEPSNVVVLDCHARLPAELPQAILSSVVDAYFVRCAQQRQASSTQTQQLLEQARRYIRDMQARLSNEAQLRSLVDALGKAAVDSATMEQLSQQRSALLLRRNHLQQQLTQMQRGQGAVPTEVGSRASKPGPAGAPPASAAQVPAGLAPTALTPGIGTQERVAQLLEADQALALRYGANHPKRKAVRLEISLLGRYPPEQAQLLAEQWSLMQQFGPSHPRVKVIQQRLDELGVAPLTMSVEPRDEPAAAGSRTGPAGDLLLRSADASPQEQLTALRAALAHIDEQDREITQQVEAANQSREVAAELRQVLQSLPAEANLQTIDAALERLAQLNAAQSALRPYLAMRPALGVRSHAGLNRKLLSGAGAGAAVGVLLSLVMLWARGAKQSAA